MIISDMKKNELTETEMNSVAGGVSERWKVQSTQCSYRF